MIRAKGLALLIGLSLLAGCAAGPVPINWKPRTDADLKTDLALCKKDADSVDVNVPEGSKYSAIAAMASRTNEIDLTNGSLNRMYDAVMYQCMTEKGWKPAS